MHSERLRVRAALKVPSSEIQEICTTGVSQALELSYSARRSSELDASLRKAVWSLLERNMHTLAEASSMGWDVKKKRLELFHRFSRFIMVFQGSDHVATKLVAFTMFRFEHEDGECILYCYELQIEEEMRGVGVGRDLMTLLECIGSRWRMDKAMLTVLKANEKALKFYTSAGFIVDGSSPSKFERDKDYKILSKALPTVEGAEESDLDTEL